MKSERMWKKVLNEFPADADAAKIEATAHDLESLHYEPLLLIKTPGFLRMGRKDLQDEILRVTALTPAEMMAEGFGENADFNEFKAKQIQLLLYHYGMLCRLREDDPGAWDTVNELYSDD